jgi:phosphoadenosine phosphosulfate reductase
MASHSYVTSVSVVISIQVCQTPNLLNYGYPIGIVVFIGPYNQPSHILLADTVTMTQCTVSLAEQLDLATLNQQFESAHPKSILMWCLENIPQGLAQSTAFGAGGTVLMDLLYQDLSPFPPIPVVFLDTLHHFPETLALADRAGDRYSLDLRTYQPQGFQSRQAFADHYGDALWERDLHQYHQITKVEPLQRALQELGVTAWITGRRRDQSATRTEMSIFEWDAQGRLKINPLAAWTYKDIWRYVVENQVLYNPLYDQGYASIGDQPLTTRVQEGEQERAGRWRGTDRLECGMHA